MPSPTIMSGHAEVQRKAVTRPAIMIARSKSVLAGGQEGTAGEAAANAFDGLPASRRR